jgi:hypothetical protein
VVFGKELPSNDKKQQTKIEPTSKKRKRIFNQNEIELDEKLNELDEYKRPKIKVALLAGAPGLGELFLFFFDSTLRLFPTSFTPK